MRSAMAMGLFLLFFSAAAPADVIEITLEVESPDIEVNDRGFTHVGIEGYRNLADPGHPALPTRSVTVLLPPGHAVVSAEAQPSS
jgi:hypothetical protein